MANSYQVPYSGTHMLSRKRSDAYSSAAGSLTPQDQSPMGTVYPSDGEFMQPPSSATEVNNCGFVKGVIDDCSRSRLWQLVADFYLTRQNTFEPQQFLCPLSRCRSAFDSLPNMLMHLKVCKHFSGGNYQCPMCGREETCPTTNSCKKCSWDRLPFRARFGNSVENLFANLTGSIPHRHHPSADIHDEPCYSPSELMSSCSDRSEMSPSTIGGFVTPPGTAIGKQQPQLHGLDTGTGLLENNGAVELPVDATPCPEPKNFSIYELFDNEAIQSLQCHASQSAGLSTMPSIGISEFSSRKPSMALSSQLTSPFDASPTSLSSSSQGSQFPTHVPFNANIGAYQSFPVDDGVEQRTELQLICNTDTAPAFEHTLTHKYNHPDNLWNISPSQASCSPPPSYSTWPADLEGPSSGAETQSHALEYPTSRISTVPESTIAARSSPGFSVEVSTDYPNANQFSMEDSAFVGEASPTGSPAHSDATLLEQHYDLERDPRCSKCGFTPGGKAENHRAYLRKHLKIHTKRQISTCEECGRDYTRQDNLTAHMKRAHRPKQLNNAGKAKCSKGGRANQSKTPSNKSLGKKLAAFLESPVLSPTKG